MIHFLRNGRMKNKNDAKFFRRCFDELGHRIQVRWYRKMKFFLHNFASPLCSIEHIRIYHIESKTYHTHFIRLKTDMCSSGSHILVANDWVKKVFPASLSSLWTTLWLHFFPSRASQLHFFPSRARSCALTSSPMKARSLLPSEVSDPIMTIGTS